MKKKERFSLRKYKIGTVSVLLGVSLWMGATSSVSADELSVAPAAPQVELQQGASDVSNAPELPQVSVAESAAQVAEAAAPAPAPVEVTAPVIEAPVVAEATPAAAPVVAAASQERVQSAEARPQNADSNALITVPEVWDRGYRGQGQVVAIIDSGLDVEHDSLRLTDVSEAKFKSAEDLERAKAAAGIDYGRWYSDKVVFAYNYVDANDVIKEEDKRSHGMHVTSIAAGNPSRPAAGQLMYGVAPEAQVLFMRVFSDRKATTGAPLYVRAIEDAVKLGADSINLSLGGANGSVVNMSDTVVAAIEAARRAGVSVVIAAGNDGAFGSGHALPLASQPDYGLVGTPSTARDAISVASYNNTTMGRKVLNIIGLEQDASLNYGRSSFENPEKSPINFEIGKEYDYVFAGLGKEEDFAGLDLAGKLALIQRGEITFSDKIAHATAAGAAGVIIFNNRPGEANVSMSLDETAVAIPSAFIPMKFGEALASQTLKIQFNDESEIVPNPEAGQLSDFSSWGLSADGELKPDLAAPGGSIYAAINDQEYANMQGTSMAAPHVAGAAVLVKQALQAQYPDKTPQELEALVKHLLMSTARPHVQAASSVYTSPRQQGAGLIDTKAALATGLYLTGADGYSSVTLGNVGDRFDFTVTLHNLTAQDQTLEYVTQVTTDTVEEGRISLVPRLLQEVPGGTVTVKAQSATTVTISLDASRFAEELGQLMPNGYYLEGFVSFKDPVDGGEVVSLPYVGFRGQFQNLAVVEQPIYDLLADGQGGFYFSPQNQVIDADQAYTGLITDSSEFVVSTGKAGESSLKTLGAFKQEDQQFTLVVDGAGKPHLALSPNGDGNQDSLVFKGVFLRNYTNLVASVYRADDLERKESLWTSQPESGDKNFFGGNEKNEKATVLYQTEWAGRDSQGQRLPDGRYQYVLTYYSEVPGAEVQTMAFDVVVDRQAPVITTATYDEAQLRFHPRPALDRGESGLYRERVFYLVKDESGFTTLSVMQADGDVTVQDHRVYVARNEDGSFSLPLDLADLSQFYYSVEDYAGNVVYEKVKNLVEIGNDRGLVKVSLLDKDTGKPLSNIYSYSVRDESGQVVADIPRYAGDLDRLKLPFGTYTFELFLHDSEWSSVAGETKFVVHLDETNSIANVDFQALLKEKAHLLVDVDQLLPEGVTMQLLDGQQALLNLPQAKYSQTDYGKLVPVGHYQLVSQLPAGYEFLEDLDVEVLAERLNVKRLTLINKTALAHYLEELAQLEQLALYYNADDARRQEVLQALDRAREVLVQKHAQAEVDGALTNLRLSTEALNGLPTDVTALIAELGAYPDQVQQAAYYNAESGLQVAYNTLVRTAQLLLSKENLPQAEVNQALADVQAARLALNGQATNLSPLNAAVAASASVQSSPAYYNGSESSRQSYDAAVTAAQALLVQGTVSQVQASQALTAVEVAKSALDGQATDLSQLTAAVAVSASVQSSSAYYNGSESSRQAYDAAVTAAQALLGQGTVSQVQASQALAAVEAAKSALDGQATDLSPLNAAVAASASVQSSPAYYNGSESSRQSYDAAVTAAQALLGQGTVSQVQASQALAAVEAAKSALDGQATDLSPLNAAVAASASVQSSPAYYNGSESSRQPYDAAVASAQSLLSQANVSQAQVNQSLATVEAARSALDGQATERSALESAVQTASLLRQTDARYLNASKAVKQAYDQAFAQVQASLTDELLSQAQADQLLAALLAAQEALDGRSSVKSEEETPLSGKEEEEVVLSPMDPPRRRLVSKGGASPNQVSKQAVFWSSSVGILPKTASRSNPMVLWLGFVSGLLGVFVFFQKRRN
ncbi:S8 family serine peptidase [Streptococcus danieliae]|uniref:S8 family serine peptidase n=1 Tax=Streptococcus danieliae TaxID=747656 RepID=UPI0023EE4543|nr:S8 family serine peptidase [Streptococcus danieliae]